MNRKLPKNPLLLLAGVGIAWLVVICVVGQNGFTTLMRQKRSVKTLQEQVEALRLTNAALKEEIKRLTSDGTAIETYAREELFMARPQEKVIVVLPSCSSPSF